MKFFLCVMGNMLLTWPVFNVWLKASCSTGMPTHISVLHNKFFHSKLYPALLPGWRGGSRVKIEGVEVPPCQVEIAGIQSVFLISSFTLKNICGVEQALIPQRDLTVNPSFLNSLIHPTHPKDMIRWIYVASPSTTPPLK